MRFPFFTATDKKLVSADANRDPLALLPVWSYFGRQLVPHLAGPVVESKGIVAVLLIYYVSAKVLNNDLKQYGLSHREYFRLMEGLLEWHLQKNKQHCFGTLTFQSGPPFVASANDASTAVNGLYQYYRGTCRNAKLLSTDWQLAPQAVEAMDEAWRCGASTQLVQALKQQSSSKNWTPATVLKVSPYLKDALERVFCSSRINKLLYDTVLGEHPSYVQLAGLLANLNSDDPRLLIERMAVPMQNGQTKDLLAHRQHIAWCEPFLMAVRDCFDYLRASANGNLAGVACALFTFDDTIKRRARDFLLASKEVHKPHASIDQVSALARAAQDDTVSFLKAIVEHHAAVAADRDRDPLLVIEAGKIVVLVEPERNKGQIGERLGSPDAPWDNGYYLTNARRIYMQLKEQAKDDRHA